MLFYIFDMNSNFGIKIILLLLYFNIEMYFKNIDKKICIEKILM